MNFRWLWLKILKFWKHTLPQGIFGRSMLILITPIALTLLIGLFVFFDRHWSTTTTRLSDSLVGEIVLVTQAWEHESDVGDKKQLLESASKYLGLKVEHNANGSLPRTRGIDLPGVKSLLKKSLNSRLHRPFAVTPFRDNSEWVIISLPVEDGGILNFYVPQKRLFSTTTYVFLLFMLGSGLLLSIIAVIFMRNQIRPIHKLALAAEQFGKGIDVVHFKPSGAREIRQAASSFLEMRDRIQRQIKQRTDMLAGVSHDLRTPLTRLKLHLAMLPQGTDTEAMQGDIKAMEKMIKAYLDFARGEGLENPLRCDITELLQQAIHDAERQGLTGEATLPDTPVIAMVRPQAIQRVFGNILENARLYAPNIWITMNKRSRDIEIIFDDNGPGIPEALRNDVFRPFQRGDESRNQDIEGTGLGLTIARDLIHSHGGTISLDTSPQGGLRVTIHLPL